MRGSRPERRANRLKLIHESYALMVRMHPIHESDDSWFERNIIDDLSISSSRPIYFYEST